MDVIRQILERVSVGTDREILFASGPINALHQSVTFEATGEVARDALERALMLSPIRMFWNLLYDYGQHAYYFNLDMIS